jgi:hypothetical protein
MAIIEREGLRWGRAVVGVNGPSTVRVCSADGQAQERGGGVVVAPARRGGCKWDGVVGEDGLLAFASGQDEAGAGGTRLRAGGQASESRFCARR